MAELQVTVERVRAVMHHPNADRLDLVTVRGWQVIVGRDQYKVGDLCIYVPIDSVLPVDLAHEWDVAKYLRGNMRIRTLKLRGSVSQGLVVSIAELPDYYSTYVTGETDIKDRLGITKWVPKGKPSKGMRLQQGQKMNPNGSTPWFPRYTDIDHLGNNPMAFGDDDWVVVKEKRHGTNFRMGYVKKEKRSIAERLSELYHGFKARRGWTHDIYMASKTYLHVGSHNVIREYHKDDLYWRAALKVLLQAKAKLAPGLVFFFEISGPGIQSGFDYGQPDGEFTVECIDIYNNELERYYSYNQMESHCHRWGIPTVPILTIGEWRLCGGVLDKYVSGKATGADHIREGVVVQKLGQGTRKIFKYISPEYLILQGKKKPEEATEWH